MLPLFVIGGLAVIFIAASARTAEAPTVITKKGTSKSLVYFTFDGRRVLETPQALWSAAQKKAGMTFPFYAFLLATLASSEYNSGSARLKSGVMHAALNYSKRYKVSLEKMLIPDGKLGKQKGRYASTALPPTLEDVKLALQVLSGAIKDPTNGAVQFDSPRTQLVLWKKGDPDHKHPNEIAKDRQASGKVAYYIPGEDPENARFWRMAA